MAWTERQNRSCIRLQELPRGGRNTSVESEESPGGGRLCVAGGLVHQVGDALEVNGNVEMSPTNDTRRNGEQVNIRERHRTVRETVRIVLHLRQIDRHSLLSLLSSSLSRQTSIAAEMRSAVRVLWLPRVSLSQKRQRKRKKEKH